MEGIKIPPDDDVENMSLPAETERASRGSDGPPNLQDVADGFASPETDSKQESKAGTSVTGECQETVKGNGEGSGAMTNGAIDSEDTNININGFRNLIESMINDNDDSVPNSQRTQSEGFTDRSVDGTGKKRTKTISRSDKKGNEDKSAEETIETRPRLLIMDLSGEGAVYSLRIDLAKERLVVGKTVEPEYWRPIRALRDYGVVVFENELYIIGGFSLEDRKCSSNATK